MENTYQTNVPESTDILQNQLPLEKPGMLNVLTILTFIGCGLQYLGAIISFFMADFILKAQEMQTEQMEEMKDKLGDENPLLSFIKGSQEVSRVQAENKYIFLLGTLLFVTFCLIGAIQMRKLKMSGYWLYQIGELGPIVLITVMLGTFAGVASLIIPLLFIILYSTQRKYLIK